MENTGLLDLHTRLYSCFYYYYNKLADSCYVNFGAFWFKHAFTEKLDIQNV